MINFFIISYFVIFSEAQRMLVQRVRARGLRRALRREAAPPVRALPAGLPLQQGPAEACRGAHR